jgi:hypothetical protein
MIAAVPYFAMLDTMPNMNNTITKKPPQLIAHVSFSREKAPLYYLLKQEADKTGLSVSTVVAKALKFYFDYK